MFKNLASELSSRSLVNQVLASAKRRSRGIGDVLTLSLRPTLLSGLGCAG